MRDFIKSVPEKHKKLVLSKGIFTFYNEPLKETLTDIKKPELVKELVSLNALIFEICTCKELSSAFTHVKALIRAILGKGPEFIDEIYVQLYRQCNKEILQYAPVSKDFYDRSMVLMCIISCYALPSDMLLEPLRYWLYAENTGTDNSIVKELITRLEARKARLDIPKHYWIPSSVELNAKFKNEKLQITIGFGEDTELIHEIFPYTTVNHIMAFLRDKNSLISKEPDKHYYWLYKLSNERGKFDKALHGEEKYFFS